MSEAESQEEKRSTPSIYVEQTLAIIKPDAIDKADEIEEIILKHGFSILRVKIIHQHLFLFL